MKRKGIKITAVALILCLIGSNAMWYLLYSRQSKRIKNQLIPPLTNDYYTNQLILTNIIKKYEAELPASSEIAADSAVELSIAAGKYLPEAKKQYQVPLTVQLPDYPNGCEAASAVMLLNYYRLETNLDEFTAVLPKNRISAENGTRFGPDPAVAYAGDPKSETGGWGCFDIVIAKTIQKMLGDRNSSLKAIANKDKQALPYLADIGPCLIWITIDYKAVKEVFTWQSYDKKETYTYPRDEHVVVLTGYDKDYYYINDPLKNETNIPVKREQLEESFDSLGRQAVRLFDAQQYRDMYVDKN